jgi:hypothetical protein
MKMWPRFRLVVLGLCAFSLLAACSKGGTSAEPDTAKDAQAKAQPEREPPPAPGEAKDLSLPPVQVADLKNGLQVNTIVTDQLPVVYATLVIRSGGESDPAKLPGLCRPLGQLGRGEHIRRRSRAHGAVRRRHGHPRRGRG